MPNPDSERTEQAIKMDVPSQIEFKMDSKRVLCRSLLAVTPEEGCALLIGNSVELKQHAHKGYVYRIKLIWPCCNTWKDRIYNHQDLNLGFQGKLEKEVSKENRFLIDPNEQISAQKWARSKNLKVLGSAHSHPLSPPIPSKTDLSFSFVPNLMIIFNCIDQEMKAWWIHGLTKNTPIEIPLI